MASVRECAIELVDYSLYSPDLALFDYDQFPKPKEHLVGDQYRNDDNVISAFFP